jgi:hypothetical protein
MSAILTTRSVGQRPGQDELGAAHPEFKAAGDRADSPSRVRRRLRTARAWTVAVVALLITAACASARPAVTRHSTTSATPHHTHADAHAPQRPRAASVASPGRLIGVGDVPGCLTGSPSGLSVLRS